MLPAIKMSGINALPCGIEAEPTVDEVNYQAYSLAGSIYAPDDKQKKTMPQKTPCGIIFLFT